VQAIGVHSEYQKCEVTSLVMWYFLDLLARIFHRIAIFRAYRVDIKGKY